jgi:hypothetical protein
MFHKASPEQAGYPKPKMRAARMPMSQRTYALLLVLPACRAYLEISKGHRGPQKANPIASGIIRGNEFARWNPLIKTRGARAADIGGIGFGARTNPHARVGRGSPLPARRRALPSRRARAGAPAAADIRLTFSVFWQSAPRLYGRRRTRACGWSVATADRPDRSGASEAF